MNDDNPLLEETHTQSGRHNGLYLIGVARAKTWRGRKANPTDDDLVHVRYRDLEALTRPQTFEMPELDPDAVQAHQRAVETAMRRGAIVPAPFGLVFDGRRPLIRMLQDQYLMLDEALSIVDGQCEVRLHLSPADHVDATDELVHAATQVYSDRRRSARAAVPFPREGPRLLGAAFLVEKTAWVEFIQRAEDLTAAQGELSLDITGPWPPYDFVKFVMG